MRVRRTAPFLAPDTGSFPVFQLLLQHGADIYALDWYGNNFLHYCVGQAEAFGDKTFFPASALQMLRVALEMGVDVHHDGRESSWGENGSDGYRPIRAAVKHRSYWAIPSLIEYGAAFVRPNDSYSLFLSAACRTCFESALLCSIEDLLEAGADVHAQGGRALEILYSRYQQRNAPYLGRAITMLVVAGDRRLRYIPSPCPELVTALPVVWKEAPEDLPGIFQRLIPPVQERVRTALLTLKRFWDGMPEEVRWIILSAILT